MTPATPTVSLREAALEALKLEEELRVEEAKRRREREARELKRRLRLIVGHEYQITTDPHADFNGEPRAVAVIDGIRFALSYQIADDPYAPAYVGVCQKCKYLAVSEAIGELSEIGEQLTRFRADQHSHRCGTR